MHTVHMARVIQNKELAPGIFDAWLECAALAKNAAAGQFIHIRVGRDIDAHLRRPISVCDVESDRLRFIYQVKGEGTRLISRAAPGDTLDVLGPLGQGFTPIAGRAVVVGGGIGVYPLLLLAKQLKSPKIFIGFRTKELVTLEKDFAACDPDLIVCTDDGSYGRQGYVTQMAEQAARDVDMIYACGPLPMLKSVKALGEKYARPMQISMEERMACGVGACQTCVCAVNGAYKTVCADGPVFKGDELEL